MRLGVHLRIRRLLPSRHGRIPRGLRGGAQSISGCDLPRVGKEPRYQQAEDEAADVGEERDAAPVRLSVEQPEGRFDELVQDQAPRKIRAGIWTRKTGRCT